MIYFLAQIHVLLFNFAAGVTNQQMCDDQKANTFFGLPTWYKYLETKYVSVDGVGTCKIVLDVGSNPVGLGLVGLAIIDMLLRVGGIVAVGYVIYGGIQYIASQGEPDNTAKALHTIINASIGLAVVMISAAAVAFIGNRLG